MPAIIINSIEMTDEQKREIAACFISKFSEVTQVPKERIYLFFNGYGLNDVSAGGVLFCDRKEIKARCKFNEHEWNKDK